MILGFFKGKLNGSMMSNMGTFLGMAFGILMGISFSTVSMTMLQFNFPSSHFPSRFFQDKDTGLRAQMMLNHGLTFKNLPTRNMSNQNSSPIDTSKLHARGAERLPPGIIASETDLYPRRLWGHPTEDHVTRQKYLVAFTVGYKQKLNINAAVKKFSENFTIMLFHYDGHTSEWDEFEWSKRAIHVSVKKQAKWWYAKRFLHPDVVAPYEYIFLWDEDLIVEHFNAEEYLKLVRKYGLEISQPGMESTKQLSWYMTKRRPGKEVHKETVERPGWCTDPNLPPCAAFIEIMAPVFSGSAWRCVWHMIQNDLIHGWGLDLALRRCVEPAHVKIGVVDSQWIMHLGLPSLGDQGQADNGRASWVGVRERCQIEWAMFRKRVEDAEKDYYKAIGIIPNSTTAH